MGCKCAGSMIVIAGVLVLVNTFWLKLDLGLVLGVFIILAGLAMIGMPDCQGGTCCPGKKDKLVKLR